MLARNIPFPFTHDLALLLSAVEADAEHIPEEIRAAARLTRYAVATRYPGVTEEVTSEDHLDAVRIAEAVVAWVEVQIDASDVRGARH